MPAYNSVSAWTAEENKKLQALVKFDVPLAVAVTNVNSQQTDRIFVRGAATNGTIGKYSTKPIYISNKQSPKKLRPKGKTGKTKFANGQRHVSAYFAGGYKEFRGQVGRVNSFVNLNLTASLRNDFATPPVRVSTHKYNAGVRKKSSSKKLQGAESHFNKRIFGLTDFENDLLLDTIIEEFRKL